MTSGHTYRDVELPEEAAWMREAVCRGMAPDLFFPERGEDVRPALTVCAECPVRVDCLAYALDHCVRHGVWGGTTERDRQTLRRRRRR
jgi:WhiB family redox-sensing transcriptional regulator